MKEMAKMCGNISDRIMCVIGGQDPADDRKRFELKPLIIIGTIGKIKYYL